MASFQPCVPFLTLQIDWEISCSLIENKRDTYSVQCLIFDGFHHERGLFSLEFPNTT